MYNYTVFTYLISTRPTSRYDISYNLIRYNILIIDLKNLINEMFVITSKNRSRSDNNFIK